MTTRRYYANAAPQRTLSGSLTSSASSLAVSGTFAGWPTQFPFYATLDIGTASAEIVLVTAVASSTATIVRGQDGTAAITHAAGATFDQTVVRQDFDEASAHTSANAGVHGVSGSVVGTTDAQTLTNKTLASPIATGTLAGATQTLSGSLTVSGSGTALTVANNATVSGTLTAGNVTASSNGLVTGVAAYKQYATEAAATAASVNTAGNTVYLTAPVTGPPGVYTYFNAAWIYTGPKTAALMRQTVGQSLPNQGGGTFTNLTWSGSADVLQGFATVSSTGVTVTQPGVYRVSGIAALPLTVGSHSAYILKNAAAVNGGQNSPALDPNGTSTTLGDVPVGPLLVTCAANDVLSIGAQQGSGVSQTTTVAAPHQSFIQVEQI